MRLLITGSHGQVGTCLTRQLADNENVEVLALDREHLDITSQEAVNAVVAEFQPEIIINAAAHTAVDKAEEEVDLSYAINRDGPKYLAQAAQSAGAAILHISTDYVFEGNKVGGYIESDTTNPQGVYGKSKLAGEIAVVQACEKHVILRTAWVFGENGNNFVKTMLRLGENRETLSIVGDQFGGPTYAGDIAGTLIQIAKCITQGDTVDYGVYHYSGLPHVSWFDFADAIFDVAVEQGVLVKKPNLTSITTDQYPTPAKRPSNSRLSTEKITLGFSVEASDWKAALKNIQAYTG
ncbi:dTDP-4-dehydrorhamnose reductase [Vibrio sp. 10N.261.46.E12]|uniref:dTDP-4-dehydrorhamnose reductase n=1 Tax=unclassified Vibrio TaxID=2614977 RepID=UPI0009759DC2|nr:MULTISPECIES: dTDP-4-dehydrorhamnose reductase [unclassified Vibrio]OMO32568.1 dTDP-4-dehydrorhamnose reductase [Vibrio sp. 10N.261.45.E1]PMJ26046.1 dTDP-4-dehydrorhamnose reductase [Vibrio sp. 10N.286.45.B6]PML89641.1 dTDP-4-dehydrorhamnose reductase [Vibrio sp. 10N.261.49.E11]PMM69691.1 dTDP-4-dehydrorhamnose reductase [Vibrio sp. 10N.261.46.F12]PMM90711.1 dTDP-4-dehydrorhamnose reductase [Vibrio sp. 10N.261.46.E8]